MNNAFTASGLQASSLGAVCVYVCLYVSVRMNCVRTVCELCELCVKQTLQFVAGTASVYQNFGVHLPVCPPVVRHKPITSSTLHLPCFPFPFSVAVPAVCG